MALTLKELISEKDEHVFNLKLEKEELAYLFKIIVAEYRYHIELDHNNHKKGHFLLGLIIKLKNKYWELTEK